jgi:hypothetical protein
MFPADPANARPLPSGAPPVRPASEIAKDPVLFPDTFPDFYALVCEGVCLEPIVPHGASVAVTKLGKPKAGDFVCIWQRPEIVSPGQHQLVLKRLVLDVPPWVKFPYQDHPDSDVAAILIAEQFNPRRSYRIRCSDLLAVHKAIGYTTGKIGRKSISTGDLLPFKV